MKTETKQMWLALLAAVWLALAGCSEEPTVRAKAQERSTTVSATAGADVQPSGPRWVTAWSLLDDCSDSLARGHAETLRLIESIGQRSAEANSQVDTGSGRLDLAEVLDEIRTLDGHQLHDLEGEAVLRELYRRAELAQEGQGLRTLAALYLEAAREYRGVDDDPTYAPLKQVGPVDPAGLRFVSAAEAAGRPSPVPEAIDRAVSELAHVYANGDMPSFSRAFRSVYAPPPELSTYFARHGTLHEAMLDVFRNHGPPPQPIEGLEQLMRTIAHESPAVGDSRDFVRALFDMEQLRRFEPSQDGVHSRLSSMQDEIPSRLKQVTEAAQSDMPGVIKNATSNTIIQSLADLPGSVPSSAVARLASKSAQQYANYVSTSFQGPSTGGGGSGVANVGNRSARTYTVRQAPAAYRSNVSRGTSKVSRTFSTAIRSPRAARGVAAGAPVVFPAGVSVTHAAWVANRTDDRFGRLVLQIKRGETTSIVATRTLFTDSALAAVDVLWGGHYGVTRYEDGDILVLMSMDPFDVADPQKQKQFDNLLEEARRIQAEHAAGNEPDWRASMRMSHVIRQLDETSAQIPRRVVFHPALWGRELAWSTARVDFWFNDVAGLSREASMANGGQAMPMDLRGLTVEPANTWQFYERDAEVMLNTVDVGVGRLSVRSTGEGTTPSTRSHYAVTLFQLREDEPEARELHETQREIQPMLDWLAVNHHDFVRLNDFSEALSILRWVEAQNVSPILLDMDGPPAPMVTPDRLLIGDGPKVR